MPETNEVVGIKQQKTSPVKLKLSVDPDLFFHTDAASQISDAQQHTEGQRARLQSDIFKAIHAGELAAYDMLTASLLQPPISETTPLCVRPADLNDWAQRSSREFTWTRQAQSSATPTATPTATTGPRTLTTIEIASCIAGLRGWEFKRWQDELVSPDKWLAACQDKPGASGGPESTWFPVAIGEALVKKSMTWRKT